MILSHAGLKILDTNRNNENNILHVFWEWCLFYMQFFSILTPGNTAGENARDAGVDRSDMLPMQCSHKHSLLLEWRGEREIATIIAAKDH